MVPRSSGSVGWWQFEALSRFDGLAHGVMFAAIFAGLGIAAAADVGSAALLTAGVFLGSAVWWVILSAGVGASKSRFSPRALVWVNRLSGAVIAGFGIAAFIRVLG